MQTIKVMHFDHLAYQLKKPLIHVGYPKALSSWMKKHLYTPQRGYFTVLNSLETTLSVIDPSPFTYSNDKPLEFINAHIGKTPDAQNLVPVIVAEALIGNFYCGGYNAKQNADRLKELCPDARILIIVREQRRLIRSLYKTMVTWGMPHSIERLLNPDDTSMVPQFNWDFLRFDLLASYYQHIFGKDNVLILPYEMFAENPLEFIRQIYRFNDIEPQQGVLENLPVSRKVNRGQTLLNILLQRLHNLVFLSSPFNYAGLFRSTEKRIKKRIKRSKNNPFPKFLDNCLEQGFANKVKKVSAGKFSASNANLESISGLDLAKFGYELPETRSQS